MGSGLSSWIDSNWLAALGVVAGIWVPYALRPPSARIRYWTTAASSYVAGVESTTLHLRNISDRAVTVDEWRSPLMVVCAEGIDEVLVAGVSHLDIEATAEIVNGERDRVILKIARLDPGDEISFNIRHAKTVKPPGVRGEIRGAPDSLDAALTLSQRLATVPALSIILSIDYLMMSSIAWMAQLRLNESGIIRGMVFALASPLVGIISSLFMGRETRRRHPSRPGCVLLAAGIVWPVFGITGLAVSELDGYRLWYPQFAVFAILAALLQRFVGRTPISARATLMVREEWDGSAAINTLLTSLACAVFAICVAFDADSGAVIWVGVVAAAVYALADLGPRSASRMAVIFGNPSRHLLAPRSRFPHGGIAAQPAHEAPMTSDGADPSNQSSSAT